MRPRKAAVPGGFPKPRSSVTSLSRRLAKFLVNWVWPWLGLLARQQGRRPKPALAQLDAAPSVPKLASAQIRALDGTLDKGAIGFDGDNNLIAACCGSEGPRKYLSGIQLRTITQLLSLPKQQV
jgi:hypothetical protein